MNDPFNQIDASPEITETRGGDVSEFSRNMRVGPDLQAAMSSHIVENAEPHIGVEDVVDGNRDRLEMLTRDEYDDDFDRLNKEIADCDERMASMIDPETGKPHRHLDGDYRRQLHRRAGLRHSVEHQEALANLGRQARVDAYEANVAEDAKRVTQMEKALSGLRVRFQGRDL
jgi:hypothetical protein